MNDRIDRMLYESGLTAQGCWDELDDYAKEAIERFGQLLIKNSMIQFIQLTDYDPIEEKDFSVYIQSDKIVKILPAKIGSYVETIDGRTSPVKETPLEILDKINQ